MSNIVPVQFKVEVNESLVEILEDALAKAKSGEMVSGKIIGTMVNGDILTDFSSTENAILELAAVTRLLHRINLSMDEAGR